MILYDTKYLQLKSAKSKSGNAWIYAHRPNTKDVVIILPIIENTKVMFLKEERPPIQVEGIGKFTIGLPAGLVGDERAGESIKSAIEAELLEETGLKADKIEIAARNVASSAGCTSETFTIAIAYINKYKIVSKPVSDGGVIVDRILINIENIPTWLQEQAKEGNILTAQMLSALYYLK